MVSGIRWSSEAPVSAIAMASVQPMPSRPTLRPLKTLVIMNAMPWTVPTRPLALSRPSSGTSRVTVVDSAMLRMLSTTLPARMTAVKSQNHGLSQSESRPSPRSSHSTPEDA